MTKSPIFILGHPKSGEKLLRDRLRSHPNITFPQESQFIPRLYKAYGNPKNDREAVRLAEIILNLHWVRAYGLSLEPSLLAGCRSYAEIVSRIFEEWARKEDKPRWGDKTPQYVTEIPTLIELFPSCKIIHVYRDGRDIALVSLERWYGPGNIFAAASSWKRLVSAGRQAGMKAGPDRYMEVSFESLINHASEKMDVVCRFLDEPYSEKVLNVNQIQPEAASLMFGNLSDISNSMMGMDSSDQGKWKEEMSVGDRVIFESVAGDLLRELGYETEGLSRPITSPEKIMWRFHNFFSFINKQLGRKRKRLWLPDVLLMKWAAIRYSFNAKRFLKRLPGKAGK